jgi:hypothetical protein
MTDKIPEDLTVFPETFTLDGIIERKRQQQEQSHAEQSNLARHLRGCVMGATYAAIARNISLVRFSFAAFIEIIKKQGSLPVWVHLEHDTIVAIVDELLKRFEGAIFAGRLQVNSIDAVKWIQINEASEFLPGDDCMIQFFKPAPQETKE